MTKWKLPEGRKPLTDADMAALTHRLADTAIEQSELYQAAKRDAEEAEAYAAELEAENNLMKTSGIIEVAVRNPSVMEYMQHWEGRAEAAEAKLANLAKAADALHSIDVYGSDTLSGRTDGLSDAKWYRDCVVEMCNRARTALAELKGQDE